MHSKKKPSYITQVDSVHPARAIYKRSAFRIPIESVLRIELVLGTWLQDGGLKYTQKGLSLCCNAEQLCWVNGFGCFRSQLT